MRGMPSGSECNTDISMVIFSGLMSFITCLADLACRLAVVDPRLTHGQSQLTVKRLPEPMKQLGREALHCSEWLNAGRSVIPRLKSFRRTMGVTMITVRQDRNSALSHFRTLPANAPRLPQVVKAREPAIRMRCECTGL